MYKYVTILINECIGIERRVVIKMEQVFQFVKLGFEHISDVGGYDHILFIASMCAYYSFKEWKSLTLLVTAFTVGHSISLILSVLGWVAVNSQLIEALIPITILFTSIFNILSLSSWTPQSMSIKYLTTIGFGVIHGLGFSNFFKIIFSEGMSVTIPLLSFNIGLEIGQLGIVCSILLLKYIVDFIKPVKYYYWVWIISCICGVMSILMLIDRI